MKPAVLVQSLAIVAGLTGCQANASQEGTSSTYTNLVNNESTGSHAAAPNGFMPSGVSYSSTTEVSASMRPGTLCELAKYFNAGTGLYKVESIQGVTEEATSGKPDGFSYVELSRIEDLSGSAPERVVARISGGPAREGVTKIWEVGLSVGETIAALLLPATAQNKNYLGLHSLGVFRQKDGGFTNGQLFTQKKADLAELRSALLGAAGRSGCVADVIPDQPNAALSSPPTADLQIPQGSIRLGTGDLPAATPAAAAPVPINTDRPSEKSR